MSSAGVGAQLVDQQIIEVAESLPLPDMLGYLLRHTELTRKTLATILIKSGRLGDAFVNPQEFLELCLRSIRDAVRLQMVDGIKYEAIPGETYEMKLFALAELQGYESSLIPVTKSIHDHVKVDSQNERVFATGLQARSDVPFFLKLPGWFKIDTPLGTYNPDWGVIKNQDAYFVFETKTSASELDLRGREWARIECGKAHFGELQVPFEVKLRVEDV